MTERTKTITLDCPNGKGEVKAVIPRQEIASQTILECEAKCKGGVGCEGGEATTQRTYDIRRNEAGPWKLICRRGGEKKTDKKKKKK